MFIIPRPWRLRQEDPELRPGCLQRKTLAFMRAPRGEESASALSTALPVWFGFCFLSVSVSSRVMWILSSQHIARSWAFFNLLVQSAVKTGIFRGYFL